MNETTVNNIVFSSCRNYEKRTKYNSVQAATAFVDKFPNVQHQNARNVPPQITM
jgi:hypothetical protein